AQLRSEGPRVRYTTQERSPLVETALGLQANQEALKARILDLNRQIRDIQGTTEGNAVLVRNLNDQLEGARIAAGLVAVEGPGIVLELDDSSLPVPTGATAADYRVTPQDLRTVVDALWRAGAEAISINGERITAVTGITDVGGSVLVNYAYVTPPYQVTAIGTKGLYERLTAIDSFGELVRTRADAFGIKLSFAEPGTVVVPAFAGPVTLNEARVPADASVTGSEPAAAPAASASASAVGGTGVGSGSTDGSGGPVGAP
ncbi:MAG TPA: DUF881 domain-containing protein, partial [Candidatus Limnocylindrales bacterium]|nr:DUF881 domain-containing protein [Candidatus Limnocylindrales bacterium]